MACPDETLVINVKPIPFKASGVLAMFMCWPHKAAIVVLAPNLANLMCLVGLVEVHLPMVL